MPDTENLKKSICSFIDSISSHEKAVYADVSLYTITAQFREKTEKEILKALQELRAGKVIVNSHTEILVFDKSRLS